jgi:hypothetical protein
MVGGTVLCGLILAQLTFEVGMVLDFLDAIGVEHFGVLMSCSSWFWVTEQGCHRCDTRICVSGLLHLSFTSLILQSSTWGSWVQCGCHLFNAEAEFLYDGCYRGS